MKTISHFIIIFSIALTLAVSLPIGCSAVTNNSNPINCTACDNPYYLSSGSCLSCPTGCTACAVPLNSTNPQCSGCTSGYNLNNTNKVCFKCAPSCLTCQNLPTNCTSCPADQQAVAGECRLKANCQISKCSTCSAAPDSRGINYCTTCMSGYFAFNRQCIPCSSTCSECTFDFNTKLGLALTFWQTKLTATYTVGGAVNASLLPSYVTYTNNAYVWAGLTLQHKNNFLLAYYAYHYNQALSATLNLTLLFKQVDELKRQVGNRTVAQQQAAILRKFNTLTNKTWTVQQLYQNLATEAAKLTTCSSCSQGYFPTNPVSYRCGPCPLNCKACTDASTCTTCKDGFFDGTCATACHASCKTCSGALATQCTSCPPPKVLSGGRCYQCTNATCSGCAFNALAVCTTCNLPYSPTPETYTPTQGGASAISCFKCTQASCYQCLPADHSICLSCMYGNVLKLGVCYPCPSNCMACTPPTTDRAAECTSCYRGYILSNRVCTNCGAGCLDCSPSNPNICLECADGMYLDSTGVCRRCRDGCNLCTSFDVCTAFRDGVVIINNQTYSCRPGCEVCNPANPELCLKCMKNFYLDTATCKPCIPGCDVCTTGTACTTCAPGLFKKVSDNTCVRCTGGCLTCLSDTSPSHCLSCMAGSTLNATSNTCDRVCPNGCEACNPADNFKCSKCRPGYALSSAGVCVKCLSGCSGTCDPQNVVKCLGCANGFEVKLNQCVRCPAGCTTCLNGQCGSCTSEFSLTQNTAGSFLCVQKCKSPCATCISNDCLSCEAGFVLNGTKCNPDTSCAPSCEFCPSGTFKNTVTNAGVDVVTCELCKTNCSVCSTTSNCFQCNDGKFLDGANCVNCPARCKTCNNNDSCILCAEGYVKQIVSMTSLSDVVYSDNCVACDPNCRTCMILPDSCTSCYQGFRLFSSRCSGIFTVVYSYKLSDNFNTFLQSGKSQTFLDALYSLTKVNTTDNYITNIREGSTVVDGVISANNQESASGIQSRLGSNLGNQFTVLSVSSQVYYADSVYVPPEEEKPKSNVGLIVGVVVGGVVLVVILVLVIWKIRSNSLATKDSNNPEMSDVKDGHSLGELNARKR